LVFSTFAPTNASSSSSDEDQIHHMLYKYNTQSQSNASTSTRPKSVLTPDLHLSMALDRAKTSDGNAVNDSSRYC
jgi:hypothetical protein